MTSMILHRDEPAGITSMARSALAQLEGVPLSVPALLFRLGMADVFWQSGQSKLASWSTTISLFRDEYRVPVLPPELAAYLAVGVETVAPILLVLGLATRLGAAAMLGMTLAIQLFVYPESWPDHLLWAGPLLYLVVRGPGLLSIDHLIRRRFSAAA